MLLAVVITAARLLLPVAGEYREALVHRLAGLLGQPLQVDVIETDWYRLGPRLKLLGLTIFDKQKPRQPLIRLKEVKVGLDILSSLFSGSLQISSLSLVGARLVVVRHKDGQVRIHGFGMTPADARGDAGLLFARWALSRDRIALKIAQISWRDDTLKSNEIVIRDAVLHLRNDGQRHQLNGSALLPAVIGRHFSFAIDLQGDIMTAGQWNAEAYLTGNRLHIGRLLAALRLPQRPVAAADGDLKIWGSWQQGRLHSLEGVVAARNVLFLATDGEQPATLKTAQVGRQSIDQLGGNFAWERQAGGWRLGITDFSLKRGGRQWHSSRLQFAVSTVGGFPVIAASCSYLDLQDVSSLALVSGVLPQDARALLKTLRPTGRLLDTQLYFRAREVKPIFHLTGGFSDLSVKPWRHLPGIAGLSGHVVADDQGGLVELGTRDAHLDFRPLLRDTLPVSRLQGKIFWGLLPDESWRIIGDDLSVENQDIRLRANLDVLLPGRAASPFLSLLVNFISPSVARTARYLPVTRMRPGLVRWLEQGIICGRIRRGGAMFFGRLKDFPFDHHEGVFKVHFDLDQGVLEYAPGWPGINEIATSVDFYNRRLDMKATGRSLSSRISKAQIIIDDLAAQPAQLVVRGMADGPTADALKFLRESPLKHKFARYLGNFTAAGKSHLSLSVHKPLNSEPAEIQGRLDMTDSRLTVAEGLEISAINGRLSFSNTGLFAERIDARVLGMDSVIDIATPKVADIPTIRFRARGRTDDAAISRFLPAFLMAHLSGTTDWLATLSVPLLKQADSPRSKLLIQSDLRGVTMDLPLPLHKAQDKAVDFSLEIPLPR